MPLQPTFKLLPPLLSPSLVCNRIEPSSMCALLCTFVSFSKLPCLGSLPSMPATVCFFLPTVQTLSSLTYFPQSSLNSLCYPLIAMFSCCTFWHFKFTYYLHIYFNNCPVDTFKMYSKCFLSKSMPTTNGPLSESLLAANFNGRISGNSLVN